MNANSPILPESHIDATHDPDAAPEFDHPRTHADRIVLALRYPSAPVLGQSPSHAEPIGAVRKEIAGRVYLLAALVRMGWACSQAQESEAG